MKKLINEQDIIDELGGRYGLTAKAPTTLHLASLIKELIPVIEDARRQQGESLGDTQLRGEYPAVVVEVTPKEAEKITEVLGKHYEIMDLARTEIYDSLYDVDSDKVCLAFAENSVDESIDMLKEYTRHAHTSIEAKLVGMYPLQDGEVGSPELSWNIVDGVAFGGGKYELPLSDEDIFIIRAFWLFQLSTSISFLRECGIDVVFSE